MTPSDLDTLRARDNPWGLTAHQCLVLRLYCANGCTKRTAGKLETSPKNVEHHLRMARTRMGLLGSDIRLYVRWDRWVRDWNPTPGVEAWKGGAT
jgi:DNA-binding CsgD family transcriptional regulator